MDSDTQKILLIIVFIYAILLTLLFIGFIVYLKVRAISYPKECQPRF